MDIAPKLITPHGLIQLKASFYLSCDGCRLLRTCVPQGLVTAGRGDQPVVAMRFRCTTCEALNRPTKVAPFATWRLDGIHHAYDFATGELKIR